MEDQESAQAQNESQSPGAEFNRQRQAAQGQACHRCRQHKLRCSRELPVCIRCHRASAPCGYPAPPDRKLLAAQRVRKLRFRTLEGPKDFTIPSEQIDPVENVHTAAHGRNLPLAEGAEEDGSAIDNARVAEPQIPIPWITPGSPPATYNRTAGLSKQTPVPSPEVARLLIEMYFTRVYNATLLFHKETFMTDYAADRVPSFVTFAIFALASVFLPKRSTQSHMNSTRLELGISSLSTTDFSSYAQEWAIAATRHVLAEAVESRLETVQGCQVLGLYWFSRDVKDRSHILTQLAYSSCRLMGFHVPLVEEVYGNELFAELRRRCFWSCWMTACISQDNASFKAQSWSEGIGLPFPASEASFAAGEPEPNEAFDEAGKVVSIGGPGVIRRTSIMAELVKLFGLWWEISRFVKHHQEEHSGDHTDRLQQFFKLDRRLELQFESLHADYKYAGPSSFTSPKIDPYTLFSLQCLYHLCACALHSSLVPLFSSTPSDPEISKKLIRMCAEETMKHSMNTLNMATAFLGTRPEKSRLSSMTGYAMFVSSAIQVESLSAQGKLRTHAGYLKAAVSILKHLKEYWCPLRDLWTKLESISNFAGLDINNFSPSRNSPQPAPAEVQTDIEQIVSPEATSESGPGTDLYTYVERREAKVTSPRQAAGMARSQHFTPQNLSSSANGNISTVTSQNAQSRRTSAVQFQSESVNAQPNPYLPQFTAGNPDHMSPQLPSQCTFGERLGTENSYNTRLDEKVQGQIPANSIQTPLFSTAADQETMSSNETSAFRPLMDGFGSMNDMVALDPNTGDDDFWWTRSWGTVRII